MTTFDPGASDVLTHGLRVKPSAAAFCATKPAAIMTLGFEVFVQLVSAAMTTAPCFNWYSLPSESRTLTPSTEVMVVAFGVAAVAPLL